MKINKRAYAGVALVGVMTFTLSACWGGGNSAASSARNTETSQAAGGINALLQAQPVHSYSYSQIRQNLQELEDAQANGVATTSFFFRPGSAQNSDPYLSCPSIGAPIPDSTELTNPQQMVEDSQSNAMAATSIGQMDPTGVYKGNSNGTWVLCVGSDGGVVPQYAEPDVHTVFGSAHWDYTKHEIVLDGASNPKFSGLKK